MRKVNYISSGAALLAFASVATALRFGHLPIGVGELAVVLLFFVALRYWNALQYVRHPIILFWVGFLAIAGIGALISPVSGASSLHTGIAYIYTACFSLMALAFLDRLPESDFRSIIRAMSVVPVILLLIPFACFLTESYDFAESIGINTAFPSRIAAWSTNPNQLALFVLPLPIWLLAISQNNNWHGRQWLRKFAFLWLFFTLGLCIRSDALLLAWAIGLPLLTIVTPFWVRKPNWKMFGTMIAAFVMAFASFKFFIDGPGRKMLIEAETAVVDTITEMMTPAPESGGAPPRPAGPRPRASIPGKSDSALGVGFDQNKTGVRHTLWTHAIEAWRQSPIFGHGPGAFSYLQDPKVKEEAHNLGFDMLTQVGIAGVLLFACLYLWLLHVAWKARDPYSFIVLVTLMLFSGAHFMLRQPVFSLYLIFCAIAVKHGTFARPRAGQNLEPST